MIKKVLTSVLLAAALVCTSLIPSPWTSGLSQRVKAADVVHPLEFMINTSGSVLRDPVNGDVQKTVQEGDTFWYLKNPSDGRRWERYRYDEAYIWLERDTTWPGWDSTNGNSAYDMGPWGSGKLAPTYNWTVGTSINANTKVIGFNFLPENGTVGDYNWHPLSYDWPIVRTLAYHNASFPMGGDVGNVDVIVIETKTQGAPGNPYAPRGAERHWYARGYGFIRWQHWEDFTTDPNFSNITSCSPVRDVKMNKKNGTAQTLNKVCDTLYPTGTARYQVHQQNYGWLNWVYQGQTGGVPEQQLRSEAFKLTATGMGIHYRAYVEGIGWQAWKYNGETAGTEGQNKRIEAIEVGLDNAPTGYHVEYRVHQENIGWTSWVRDGVTSGVIGYNYRIESIQVRIVKD